ncbi:MAG: type II toxin-antitoxin system HipA family toxin [Eubacteriales bacterium]
MGNIKQLDVFFRREKVGKLASYGRQLVAFEYEDSWLTNGFSISPFSLPLEKKVFIPKIDPLDGIFGVFSDSLPDGWGRLLVDRLMLKNGMNPREIGTLDRLAIVGDSGMGALTYEPSLPFEKMETDLDLDKIAYECAHMLKTDFSEDLDQLFYLGGSSGGARPKILTMINGEEWIIKFPSIHDKLNIGEQEYRYSLCAKECGISMMDTKLFPSKVCSGYFGTKRFDRINVHNGEIGRKHMISVAGLLETSHRIPNLDYHILMKLTLQLTNDFQQVEVLFRQMCFNVFAHNRDDHSKNFTFIYDMEAKGWKLSPAYDLTYSFSIGGEHATTVNGNGKNPTVQDMMEVANQIGLKSRVAKNIIDEVKACVDVYELF